MKKAQFIVKEKSIEAFAKDILNASKVMGISSNFLMEDELLILKKPPLDSFFEEVVFELNEFGNISGSKINTKIVFEIKPYDDLHLKLVKKESPAEQG